MNDFCIKNIRTGVLLYVLLITCIISNVGCPVMIWCLALFVKFLSLEDKVVTRHLTSALQVSLSAEDRLCGVSLKGLSGDVMSPIQRQD